MNSLLRERCPTGIPGFDELCGGGLVRDSVNAVLGGPGAGKTTFLLQFLWNGKTLLDENGLFLSLEPDVADLFQDAYLFGWDFSKLDAAGVCKFLRLSPKTNWRKLRSDLTEYISKYSVKRVCIDPASLLFMNEDVESELREALYDLMSLLKRLKVTVILSSETTEESMNGSASSNEGAKIQSVKFLADGLVNLYSSGLGGVSDRAVGIIKMRRTDHVRGPQPFRITPQGIQVLRGD